MAAIGRGDFLTALGLPEPPLLQPPVTSVHDEPELYPQEAVYREPTEEELRRFLEEYYPDILGPDPAQSDPGQWGKPKNIFGLDYYDDPTVQSGETGGVLFGDVDDLLPGYGQLKAAAKAGMHMPGMAGVTFLSRPFKGLARRAIRGTVSGRAGSQLQRGSEALAKLFTDPAPFAEEPNRLYKAMSKAYRDATPNQIREAQETVKAASRRALDLRGMPDEFIVFRGGRLPYDPIWRGAVPVSLDRNVAESFGPTAPYLVRKEDVLADLEGLLGKRAFRREREFLYPAEKMTRVDEPVDWQLTGSMPTAREARKAQINVGKDLFQFPTWDTVLPHVSKLSDEELSTLAGMIGRYGKRGHEWERTKAQFGAFSDEVEAAAKEGEQALYYLQEAMGLDTDYTLPAETLAKNMWALKDEQKLHAKDILSELKNKTGYDPTIPLTSTPSFKDLLSQSKPLSSKPLSEDRFQMKMTEIDALYAMEYLDDALKEGQTVEDLVASGKFDKLKKSAWAMQSGAHFTEAKKILDMAGMRPDLSPPKMKATKTMPTPEQIAYAKASFLEQMEAVFKKFKKTGMKPEIPPKQKIPMTNALDIEAQIDEMAAKNLEKEELAAFKKTGKKKPLMTHAPQKAFPATEAEQFLDDLAKPQAEIGHYDVVVTDPKKIAENDAAAKMLALKTADKLNAALAGGDVKEVKKYAKILDQNHWAVERDEDLYNSLENLLYYAEQTVKGKKPPLADLPKQQFYTVVDHPKKPLQIAPPLAGKERIAGALGPEYKAAWSDMTPEDIAHEYAIEYTHHTPPGNPFPTEESFKEAISKAETVEVTPEMDAKISYRSRTKTPEALISLLKSYSSWPKYRNEKTVAALRDRIKQGLPTTKPIVLRYPDGKLRVLSGNTRMDIAFQEGKNPQVLMLEVPGEK